MLIVNAWIELFAQTRLSGVPRRHARDPVRLLLQPSLPQRRLRGANPGCFAVNSLLWPNNNTCMHTAMTSRQAICRALSFWRNDSLCFMIDPK